MVELLNRSFYICAILMAIILNIETATTNCSVSIGKDGRMIALKERNDTSYSHSEDLHFFIKEAMESVSLPMDDLDAIAVSKGPGSYTGLRIGVSAAKGLCFALDLPLIGISTLKSMASQLKVKEGVIVPVLDARRMEVYASVYSPSHNSLSETWVEEVKPGSFTELTSQGKIHMIGSGALKCRETLKHPNFIFDESIIPSAKEMCQLSHEAYGSQNFENTAYFEPDYLKDFVVQQSKK